MSARQRTAALTLLLALGCLTALISTLWAGPPPVPARTAQIISPEPPLAGARPQPVAPGSPYPVDPPTPVVGLRVRVPASAGPNQEIEYRITVENRSQADAHHVTVRDTVPGNARFVRATPEPTSAAPELTWQLGTLAGCTAREIVLVLAPTGTGDISNCARVQFEHGQCVTTRIERPGLGVRKVGPQQAGLNEIVTFQIIVTNGGAVPVSNVSVVDKLGEGLEHASGKNTLAWNLGTLGPGESRTVDYQVTARKLGKLCNQAAVSGDGGAFDKTETCVVVVGAGAGPAPAGPAAGSGLSLVKRGPEQRFVKSPANYQITVSNTGPGIITNVVVTDFLPPMTTLVSASDAGRLTGNQVQWLIGTLQPGARRTVQLALQAQAAGQIVNRAAATADRGFRADAQATTVFEGAAGLTFDLDVKDNPIAVGAQTSYIVTVLNQGLAAAKNVQMTVTLPEALQMVNAKGPTNGRQQGQQVVFEPLAALNAKSEVRYEITVKALREGEVKCRAELRSEALGDRPVIREQSTTIHAGGGIRLQPIPGMK
jgi:uncharacterized repeat protein (TIGR01451 family)